MKICSLQKIKLIYLNSLEICEKKGKQNYCHQNIKKMLEINEDVLYVYCIDNKI